MQTKFLKPLTGFVKNSRASYTRLKTTNHEISKNHLLCKKFLEFELIISPNGKVLNLDSG